MSTSAPLPCPRCGGIDGAHFAFCFLAQAWERFMGPGYPWAPPQPDIAALVEAAVAARLEVAERSIDAIAEFVAEGESRLLPEGTVVLTGEDAKLVRSVMVDDEPDGFTPDGWDRTDDPEDRTEVDLDNEVVAEMTVSEVQAAAREAGARIEFETTPLDGTDWGEFTRKLLEYRGWSYYRLGKETGFSGSLTRGWALGLYVPNEDAQAQLRALAAAPVPEPEPTSEPETQPAVAVEPEAAPIPEPTPAPEPQYNGGPKKTPTFAVEAWLNQEAVEDIDGRVVIATAGVRYEEWAADKLNMPATVSGLTIAKALKGRGYKRKAPLINGRQYPCYYGVRLLRPEPEPDGTIRQTVPDEQVAIVERFVTARTKPTDEPNALVVVAEMYAAYQRWCDRTGQTDIGRDSFSTAMQQLGAYPKGQWWSGKNAKQLGYLGAELTPEPLAGTKPNEVPDNQTIRKAIAAAKAAAAKQRQEAEAAAEAAATPPATVYRTPEPEVEVKPDNNGWGKTFNTDGVAETTLTVEDILAEHAEIEPRGGYAGPRPGVGDQLDDETRDLINALLNLDEGWEFIPPSGRQPKSFVKAPDGSRFRQAATFSGGRGAGRIGNNRELRRYLNQKGMLPTAGAPVSQLVSAKHKPTARAKKAESLPVTVTSKNGTTQHYSDWVKLVEAEPDAAPLTEEEMERTLFDLYTDVKDGMDREFTYHADVEALHGLNKDEIRGAVREPQRVEVRPESKVKGYPVIKFVRGDVVVIMGFRDRARPAVIRAEWGSLLAHDTYLVDRHGGGGGGNKVTTGLPNSFTQLAGRLRTLGAEVAKNPDGKTAVVTYKGQSLGLVTAEKCPRSTTHSDWNRMSRKIQAISRREPAAV